MNDSPNHQKSSQVEDLFVAALALDPAQRSAYVSEHCGADSALRQRVEALLLAHHAAKTGFLPEQATLEPTVKLDFLPPPVLSEQPGDQIGRYKLLQKIGEGGCGVVYMAEQEQPVRRRVALKVIKLGMDTKEVVARFEAERQALAMMDHPNIAKVLDAGATETGRPFFVMELVRGIKITDYCDQNKIAARERLELFVHVCRAVQHAHQKGIIHRDLKPSNILVTLHDGVPIPKVIDFGIAKATQGRLTDQTVFTAFEQFIGTPAYMSPEQAEMSGLDIDTRSDIYSLGVLLYELLTGETPFNGADLIQAGLDEMRRTIREKEPAKPSTRLSTMLAADLATAASRRHTDAPKLISFVRNDLDWIVMKCLEKDRTRRYETANGLAADVQRHLANEPVTARSPSAAYRFQKLVRRNKVAFAAAAAIAVVLVAATAVSVWQAVRARHAETLATNRLADSEAISQFLIQVFQSPDPGHDGRTITVADALDRAVKKLDTDLTNQPERRAKLQRVIGLTYQGLGLYRQEAGLLEKASAYFRSAYGPQNTNYLFALNDLADSYLELRQDKEALNLLNQTLPVLREILGPRDAGTLAAEGSLAIAYGNLGRWQDALKLEQEILPISRQTIGSNAPNTLRAMANLASCYYHLGRHQDELKVEEDNLNLCREGLGPEHPDTLNAMGNLAAGYFNVGQYSNAVELMRATVALAQKVFGPSHADTLREMRDLAMIYERGGRANEALNLRRDLVDLTRNALGPEHPAALQAMADLARSYNSQGQFIEATNLLQNVLAMQLRNLGESHPDTLQTMDNLALYCAEAGQLDQAIGIQEKAFALEIRYLGPQQLETRDGMAILGDLYFHAGRNGDALRLWEQNYTNCIQILGPEDNETLHAKANLVRIYDRTNRRDKAARFQEEILRLFRKTLPPESPDVIKAMSELGALYCKVGHTDDAIKLDQERVQLCQKALGPTNDDTIGAVADLVNCVHQAGRHEEANQLATNTLAEDPNGYLQLTKAAWQLWLGRHSDYEQTALQRILAVSESDSGAACDGASKGYCLVPSTNAALLAKAVALERRAVELSGVGSGWGQLGLGLAQYRIGQYSEAETNLAVAAQNTRPDLEMERGAAHFFRVLTLLHLGRRDEAEKLFAKSVAEMPPLPPDENRPTAPGYALDQDLLIWWMAAKEAKAALAQAAPAASGLP